ncbi:hypothetical protein JX265_001391 [Neoarthrinium moseri]|uniref:Rhodopsin domain-containing protein n=1 Tax=Neoarthrinium moseri TaxID=1658444 RepID=A0A9P9WY11_9PEZI|nr:hypothetical protein JX265_001391 [Neoarthrinium moseri]
MTSEAGQGITQAGLLAIIWVFAGLSTVLVVGRLLIRSILLKSFHLDDAFGALSWVFMIVCMICATIQMPLSYRFSSIIIGETPMPRLEELVDLTITSRKWSVASQTFFWTSLFCVKLSFMFLYRMVLRSYDKYNIAWHISVVYIVVSYGICLIGVFGQCGDSKNLFKYEECMTPYVASLDSKIIWVAWFFNVSSDLIVIILPLPVIWNLNMRTKQNYLELLITVLIGMLPSYRFLLGNSEKDREYRHIFWTHVTFRSPGSSNAGHSMQSYDRSPNDQLRRNVD